MFVCRIKNCKCEKNVKAEYIYCWLCDSLAHAKCASFVLKVKDYIYNKSCLKRCCQSCREPELNIRKFMRHTRLGFNTLYKAFSKLQCEFQAMEDKFNSFKFDDSGNNLLPQNSNNMVTSSRFLVLFPGTQVNNGQQLEYFTPAPAGSLRNKLVTESSINNVGWLDSPDVLVSLSSNEFINLLLELSLFQVNPVQNIFLLI